MFRTILTQIPVRRYASIQRFINPRNIPIGFKDINLKPSTFGTGRRRPPPGSSNYQQIQAYHTEHFAKDHLQELLAVNKINRKYYRGVLRVNENRPTDAYVTADGLLTDVYIPGRLRNRAFNGDLVVVCIYTEKEALNLFPGMSPYLTKQIGKVVGILEMSPSRKLAGTISMERPGSKSPKSSKEEKTGVKKGIKFPTLATKRTAEEETKAHVWFQPRDKRAPLMVLEAATVPREYIEDPETFKNHLHSVEVVDWPATVQHPCARFIKDMGVMGEIKVETEALLLNNGVEPETFSSEVLNCLPKAPWTIPPSEFKKRRDMRKDRIFTIDPSTARDLDDAISCRRLDDGNYEIGVHIADVSYFVKPETRLDAEAMNRATSVYLVQQTVPMLPPLLSEQCSLNPGVDRLAFSVIWIMTPNAKIVNTWFDRTIIRSACKLSYEHAQTVIEGGKLDSEIPLVGATAEEIEADIMTLFEFSKKLRSGRDEDGALSMNKIKLRFELDEDGLPTDCSVYQQKESNRLIEEFKLLANMSVAKEISSAFPEQALLRRQSAPTEHRKNKLKKAAAELGFVLDVSSTGRLQESFNQLEKEHGSEVVTVLKLLCNKHIKMPSIYSCTGRLDIEMFGHYSLNVPLYTHFTSPIGRYTDITVHRMLEAALAQPSRFFSSPIRRYTDVMVHRMLEAALAQPSRFFSVDTERIQRIARNCNRRKDASKSVQDGLERLFLSVLLHRIAKSRGGQPVESEAIVIQVQDGTFDVLVPAYGVWARIRLEDLPLENFEYNEKKRTLELYWKNRKQDGNSKLQILTTLSRLKVALDANFKKSPSIINVSVPHPF